MSKVCKVCGGEMVELSTGGICMNCSGNQHVIFNENDLTRLQVGSSSKGNQIKWYSESTDEFIKGQFNYQGKLWRDDLVEVIASRVGMQLNTETEILKQDLCEVQMVDGTFIKCSKSKNFLRKDINEYFITLLRLDNTIQFRNEFPIRVFSGILDVIRTNTGLDATEYLITMAIIDYIVCNEDRHLNNIGVIRTGEGYRLSPLFDFGLGLFEHDLRYNDKTLVRALEYTECKPFNNDPYSIILALKNSREYGGVLEKVVPSKINLVGVEMPNKLSLRYLEYALDRIGVDLIV